MVSTTHNKIIIELRSTSPDDVVYDLKCAIIFALQNQSYEKIEDEERRKSAYYFLLLLLYEMMYEDKIKPKHRTVRADSPAPHPSQ